MFPYIVILPIHLIHVISLKTRVWKVLLIFAPTDSFRIQQINDSLFLRVKAPERIQKDPVRVTAYRANVVGLTGMRKSVVVCERDTLFRQRIYVCFTSH